MAHVAHAEPLTAEEATRDIRERMRRGVSSFALLGILGILAVIGLVALISKITSGATPYTKWGYVAMTLAFLASTGNAMPMVAFATRLAKGYWALPVRRIAELGAVTGLITSPLFIILLRVIPPFDP